MLSTLLQALAGYFAADDDPTPGDPTVGGTNVPAAQNLPRFYRLLARTLVELAKAVRGVNQQVQANTDDIAAIKTKLGL